MTNFARVQNRIYYGYGKVAKNLGVTFSIYRSPNGINPIQPGNRLTDQLIWIDQDFKANKSRKYGDMTWQFTPANGLALQNYDYIISPTTTYYIGDIAPSDRLTPPMCVECNAIISIYNLTQPKQKGVNSYQEYGNRVPVITNCPVALLQYTRMDSENMKMPTSVKMPMYTLYVPEFDDILIQTGQEIDDDKGRRLVVVNAEITKKSLGVRILAQEKGT